MQEYLIYEKGMQHHAQSELIFGATVTKILFRTHCEAVR